MDPEVDQIPDGWTLDPEEPKSEIPDGWTLDPEPVEIPKTARDRDLEKFQQASGLFAVENKTREELKAMSYHEKMHYLKRLELAGTTVAFKDFSKGTLSGVTFGQSKKWSDSLKPTEFEETPNVAAGIGEITGSTLPLSGMIKIVGVPATKLAAKSPIFKNQIGSLLTMMGVGAWSKTTEQLAQGEIPSVEEVLEHGKDWGKLDLILQGIGLAGKTGYVIGKFTKDLLVKSKASGIPAKDLITEVATGVKDMIINKASPAEIQQEAFNILSRIQENPELASQRSSIFKMQLTEAELAANKAIQEGAVTPKDLKERKITNKTLENLESESPLLAEPIQPGKGDYSKEVKRLEDSGMFQKMEIASPRAATKEELGTAIREDINAQRTAEKEAYKPLYEVAEEQAQYIPHHADETAQTAFKTLTGLSTHKTTIEGLESVQKTLKGIIHDAGYKVEKTAQGVMRLVKDKKRSVSVKHTMELAKRINKKINWEALEPDVKDNFKKVVKATKNDVRAGLKEHPEALEAFNKAEAEHARVAEKYGTDAVKKVRKTEAGESIAKSIDNPTVLKDLKKTMSPKEYAKVQREVLENLREMDYLKSEKHLREVNKYLSEENQKLAKEIVEAKNPHNPIARRKAAQEEIYTDMSKALTEGTRPDKTLKLWKTTKGQKLIRDAFKNTPNGKEIIRYLEQQSFNDMVKSVMKDGVIDFKKMKEFLKDPAMLNNIREMGGEEALNFFTKMESRIGQIAENAKLLEKIPTKTEATRGQAILERMARKDFPIQSKFKDVKSWFKEMLGLNSQAAMTIFGIAKVTSGVSALAGVPGPLASYLAYGIMSKLLTSQNVRKNFLRLSKKGLGPVEMAIYMRSFNESLKD